MAWLTVPEAALPCPAARHREALGPPVAQESQKGQRWGGQAQHRTKGALGHSAHSPPHTPSLASCSVLRRTTPSESGAGQEAPVSAMALDDPRSSLETRDGHSTGEQPTQLHGHRNTE